MAETGEGRQAQPRFSRKKARRSFTACGTRWNEIVSAIKNQTHDLFETLFLPFSEGAVPLVEKQPLFLIRAEAVPPLIRSPWREQILCEQSLRSSYEGLRAAGFQPVTRITEEGPYPAGLCVFTKNKKENYGNVARAWRLIAPGGTLICAGHNGNGGKSIEKIIAKSLPIAGRIAKNHCRVFWINRDDAPQPPAEWQNYGKLAQNIPDSPFWTQPGMFCWEKIDKGSAFLMDHLPDREIRGQVADFGSGWGYLSHELLRRFPDIDQMDLYEDEWLAMEAARRNLEAFPGKCLFQWHDLSSGGPRKNTFDWVITNPPFHTSERTDVTLGCQFIARAAEALKPGGTMLLVANRQLPYEAAVKTHFSQSSRLAESAAYKVIMATKS